MKGLKYGNILVVMTDRKLNPVEDYSIVDNKTPAAKCLRRFFPENRKFLPS